MFEVDVVKIYDAEDQIIGRMASVIAKQLLNGERVFVVNVGNAVLIGNRKDKLATYKTKRERGDPHHGPFFPKTADGIFRRTVRGMLPWDRTRGREAYRRLRVYADIPVELRGKEEQFEKIETADRKKTRARYVELGELAAALGAKKRL